MTEELDVEPTTTEDDAGLEDATPVDEEDLSPKNDRVTDAAPE